LAHKVFNYEKACGPLVLDGAAASAKIAEGWTFVTIGSDSALLATAIVDLFRMAGGWRRRTPARWRIAYRGMLTTAVGAVTFGPVEYRSVVRSTNRRRP